MKEPRSPDGKSLPIEKIWDELNRLIVKQNVANEEVIDWIEVSRTTEKTYIMHSFREKAPILQVGWFFFTTEILRDFQFLLFEIGK